jgi:hypothetical protein
MATYEYDDVRVTFVRRTDGRYDVHAVADGQPPADGVFAPPFDQAELEQEVLTLARGSAVDRDVGAVQTRKATAEHLGGQLADALLTGSIGALYETVHRNAEAVGRGTRLTLSLAGTPELLSIPWEFLFRRPTFLASQRRTPVVRYLETGEPPDPERIEGAVRMLGIIASPRDLPTLDVESERARVEQAVATVKEQGLVTLDWLDPVSPRRLREALRDGSYHILHFVGHSDFSDTGEGVLMLENDDRSSSPVSETVLANLLADQTSLRLTVLNSCEGARTSLTDPFAGIATTLVQLGVPAVVAMQFAISDRAAIAFAGELYTSLIGRQYPIDASVAEARKAVLTEVSETEWATPVLFLRSLDGKLFSFGRDPAALPPPPPRTITTPGVDAASTSAPASGRGRKRVLVLGGAAAVVAVALGAGAVALAKDDGPPACVPDGGNSLARTPQNVAPTDAVPKSGLLAVSAFELDGEAHLSQLDPGSGQVFTGVTTSSGVVDQDPARDLSSNRIAFSRRSASGPSRSTVNYVVPGARDGSARGVQVRNLVIPPAGFSDRFPSWGSDDSLVYARAKGFDPSGPCPATLHRARFTVAGDILTPTGDEQLGGSWTGVRSTTVDPADPTRIVVVDRAGAALLAGGTSTAIPGSKNTERAVFDDATRRLVAIVGDGDGSGRGRTVALWDADHLAAEPIARAKVSQLVASLNIVDDASKAEMQSITLDPAQDGFFAVVDQPDDNRAPVIVSLDAQLSTATAVSVVTPNDWSAISDVAG